MFQTYPQLNLTDMSNCMYILQSADNGKLDNQKSSFNIEFRTHISQKEKYKSEMIKLKKYEIEHSYAH